MKPTVPTRSAFTLLELLLALAIIVALGAVTIPGLMGALANRQLIRGGNGFRTAMIQARLEAMRTGRTQVLRVQLQGGGFQVQPLYSASDVTEAADNFGRGQAVMFGGVAVATTPGVAPPATDSPGANSDQLAGLMDQEQLPEEVLFADIRVQATARSITTQQTTMATSGDGWSQPIYFYADGTTSHAMVTLQRADVGRVVVRIRGLTGETDISEVMP